MLTNIVATIPPSVGSTIGSEANAERHIAENQQQEPVAEGIYAFMPFLIGLGFPSCDPKFVIQELKALEEQDCPSRKRYWSSYDSDFSKQIEYQRNKTVLFWNTLSADVKTAVSNRAIVNANTALNNEGGNTVENTNKHDRARLLHVFVDPCCAETWVRALSPMVRAELDNPAVRDQGFIELANHFNNPDFLYENQVAK